MSAEEEEEVATAPTTAAIAANKAELSELTGLRTKLAKAEKALEAAEKELEEAGAEIKSWSKKVAEAIEKNDANAEAKARERETHFQGREALYLQRVAELKQEVGKFEARIREVAQADNSTLAKFKAKIHPLEVVNSLLPENFKPITSVGLVPVQLGSENQYSAACVNAKIPAVPGTQNLPSFLLHGLEDVMKDKNARVTALENQNRDAPVILFAPSGSGKTRLCLEFLCHNYGFFLCARSGGDKNFGSMALSETLERVVRDKDATLDWSADNPSPTVLAARRELATFAVDCVILAYIMIFERLGGPMLRSDDQSNTLTKLQWLLIQIYPIVFLGDDWFKTLSSRLFQDSSHSDVSRMISDRRAHQRWTCVVDEANLLTGVLVNKFETTDMSASIRRSSLGLRSALSPVLKAIRWSLEIFPISSGTGVSLMEVYRTFESGMAVTSNFERLRFDDFPRRSASEVHAFLGKVLPENDDLDRASRWLEGRFRFSTRFVENCLLDPSHSTGWHLDSFVGFMITQRKQEDVVLRTPAAAIRRLFTANWKEIDIRGAENERMTDFNPLHTICTAFFLVDCGIKSILLPQGIALVELGLACPSNQSDAKIVFEPLVSEALRQELVSQPAFFAKRLEQVSSVSSLGKEFELVLASQILPEIFKSSLESNDLITGVELPSVFRGKFMMPKPQFGRMCEPCGEDGSAFYAWMKKVLHIDNWNGPVPPYGMMLQQNHTGPDIVIVLLKHDASGENVLGIALVFVQVKCVVDKIDQDSAMRTVDPQLFCHTKRNTKPKIIRKYQAQQNWFIQAIAQTPVIRMIFSAAKDLHGPRASLIERGQMKDLILNVDASSFLEKTHVIVDCVKRLKRSNPDILPL